MSTLKIQFVSKGLHVTLTEENASTIKMKQQFQVPEHVAK